MASMIAQRQNDKKKDSPRKSFTGKEKENAVINRKALVAEWGGEGQTRLQEEKKKKEASRGVIVKAEAYC